MFGRFPREHISFQYLERAGKPRAPSLEKSKIFFWSMQLQFAPTYRHNSSDYPHIFDHGQPDYEDLDVAWRRGLRIQDGGHQTGTGNKFSTVVDCDAIPMASSTLSTTHDFALTRMTLPDVCRRWPTLVDDDRLPKFKMAASKTGSGNNFWTANNGAAIPTAIPILSTMPDFTMSMRTLPDVADYRNPRWRPSNRKWK